ncbi:hypothetical protein HDU93_003181, partial [Gonapodya sp. JEL0774]
MTTNNRRTVLIALDASPAARYALDYFLENAFRPDKDHLILMSVGEVDRDGSLFDDMFI